MIFSALLQDKLIVDGIEKGDARVLRVNEVLKFEPQLQSICQTIDARSSPVKQAAHKAQRVSDSSTVRDPPVNFAPIAQGSELVLDHKELVKLAAELSVLKGP